MDVTITLSPADVATFAANFTQARGLSAHPETLFHEATTSWVEDAADERTLNYGTCFWFEDALGAVFAKKVFEAAGETAFWLSNDQDPDASLREYPPHAVLTSWDVWTTVETFTPGRGYEPTVDESIGDTIEEWLHTNEG